ncbi:MAG: MFS transporter [Acetobacterales bacterium]
MRLLGRFSAFSRAFRHRNYRLYTMGNALSTIGLWMQRVGVGWLAWELTGSATWLGLIAFADMFPTVVISPIAGTVTDRIDRLRLLRSTQALLGLQAVTLAVLIYLDHMSIAWLLGLTVVRGIVLAFNQPARLSLISTLVGREDVAPAIAINAMIFNMARFIGPAAAGFLIVGGDTSVLFIVTALCFLSMSVAASLVRLDQPDRLSGKGGLLQQTVEGYVYAAGHAGIGPLMLVLSMTAFGARSFIELMPGIADVVFGRGADGLAALLAVMGVGAIVGGAWLAQRPGLEGLTRVVAGNLLLIAVILGVFAASGNYAVGLGAVFFLGFAITINGAGIQTLIQSSVEPSVRGRVLGLYGLIVRGAPSVGALVMGAFAERVGFAIPMLCGAAICVAAWMLASSRRQTMSRALETGPAGSPNAGD